MVELARFLFHRRDYSRVNEVVRPSAFLPNKNGETSVFEISGLVDAKVRDLGEVIGESRGIPPRGRGEFKESDVLAVGLRFERDDRPTRHGNLLGWPIEGPELRARHRAIAVELSARAALVIH